MAADHRRPRGCHDALAGFAFKNTGARARWVSPSRLSRTVVSLVVSCALALFVGLGPIGFPAGEASSAHADEGAGSSGVEVTAENARSVLASGVTAAEKQAEADEIAANIDALQTQLNEANRAYAEAQERHEQADQAARDAKDRSDAAQARIVELKGILGQRAVGMYKGGVDSIVDVILGATSFQEFVTSWDTLNTIAQHDAGLIEESRVVREEATAAQQEYVAQRATASEEMDKAEEAAAQIASAQAAMDAELARVTEEVALLQTAEAEEKLEAEEAARRAAEAETIARNNQPWKYASPGAPTSPGGSFGTPNISGWVIPVSYSYVTTEFSGSDPNGNFHNGIDLAGQSVGTPIYAAGPGTVTYVGWYGSGGKAVKISHGNGLVTIYMHMSDFAASIGQQVSAGDLIGYVGMTGFTTGPHLHFQIEIGGTPVNPRNYFAF